MGACREEGVGKRISSSFFLIFHLHLRETKEKD